jgi:hypothetical protein
MMVPTYAIDWLSEFWVDQDPEIPIESMVNLLVKFLDDNVIPVLNFCIFLTQHPIGRVFIFMRIAS